LQAIQPLRDTAKTNKDIINDSVNNIGRTKIPCFETPQNGSFLPAVIYLCAQL
jgi:hypothetical protein